jgi:hypothetical protein
LLNVFIRHSPVRPDIEAMVGPFGRRGNRNRKPIRRAIGKLGRGEPVGADVEMHVVVMLGAAGDDERGQQGVKRVIPE